jgi:hypothetical protein
MYATHTYFTMETTQMLTDAQFCYIYRNAACQLCVNYIMFLNPPTVLAPVKSQPYLGCEFSIYCPNVAILKVLELMDMGD